VRATTLFRRALHTHGLGDARHVGSGGVWAANGAKPAEPIDALRVQPAAWRSFSTGRPAPNLHQLRLSVAGRAPPTRPRAPVLLPPRQPKDPQPCGEGPGYVAAGIPHLADCSAGVGTFPRFAEVAGRHRAVIPQPLWMSCRYLFVTAVTDSEYTESRGHLSRDTQKTRGGDLAGRSPSFWPNAIGSPFHPQTGMSAPRNQDR
jgi:hypothetical protein